MPGWIKLHRKLSKNPLWTLEPFTRGQAWVDLVLLANFERGYILVRGIKIDIERGQVGWSELKLSERWKWSRSKVRTFFKLLESEQQIVQQKDRKTSIISITNYDEYQKQDNKMNNRKTTDRTTEGQQKDTKKKKEEELIIIEEEKEVPQNSLPVLPKINPEIKKFVTEFQEWALSEHGNMAEPVTDALIKNCSDIVDKLIRIDGFSKDEVFQSIRWASRDSFWSQQVKSLAGLRRKSKNKQMKFKNMFSDYRKKDSNKLNAAEKRLQSNIEVGRRFLNE